MEDKDFIRVVGDLDGAVHLINKRKIVQVEVHKDEGWCCVELSNGESILVSGEEDYKKLLQWVEAIH